MIELSGMASPNVTRISIMLEETGLAQRFHWVRVFREETRPTACIAYSTGAWTIGEAAPLALTSRSTRRPPGW